MNRLSNELLSFIFRYLSQQQKLQCMLVSRLWARILYTGPLLETIVISNDSMFDDDDTDRRLNMLIKNIQTDSVIGRSCRRLVLDYPFQGDVDKVILAGLMPNLEFLLIRTVCGTSTNHNLQIMDFSEEQSDQLQSWRDSLKTLIDHHYSSDIFALLKTGIFARLTTLVLGSNSSFLSNQFNEISHVLKNTPALTTFSVHQACVSISGLEELHNNVTQLTALTLINCLWLILDKQPSRIQQAEKMKTLEMLDFLPSTNLPLDIAHYFMLKYVNLDSISFTVEEYADYPQFDDENQLTSSFIHIVNQVGPNLKTLKVNASADIPPVLMLLDKNNTCLENLQINVSGNQTVINKITSLDCYHNISTLSLTQVPPISSEQLKRFTNLKSLAIEFMKTHEERSSHIDLNEVLFNLPNTIETLNLSKVKLSVSRKNTWYDTSIKTLKLSDVKSTRNLSNYLATHAPKLDSLSLIDCRINTQFELPEHHLTFVEIALPEKFTRWDGGWNICAFERVISYVTHLKTTIGNTTQRYVHQKMIFSETHPLFSHEYCDVRDLSIRNTCRPTQFDDNLPYFHFKCASVQTFYYNGYLLL